MPQLSANHKKELEARQDTYIIMHIYLLIVVTVVSDVALMEVFICKSVLGIKYEVVSS